MGCASSGRQVLCKGQGVENDRVGLGPKPRAVMTKVERIPTEINSAVGDVTHSGADIVEKITDRGGTDICDYMTKRITSNDHDIFIHKINSFENGLIQKGSHALGDLAQKGNEQVKEVVETLEEIGGAVEENVKTGVEEIANLGKGALENVVTNVEKKVAGVSESVKKKVEEVKDKVEDVIGGSAEKEIPEGSKDDMGKNIDELLASIDKS